MLTIPVNGAGSQLKWLCMEPGAQLVPWPDGQQAFFIAEGAGVYHVALFGLDSHKKPIDPSVCEITVGSPPGPGPGPTPPAPVDPLTKTLQDAYQSEAEPDKAKSLAALGELYAQGADAATKRTDLQTWGAYFQALATVSQTVGVWGKVMGVQKAIQAELTKALPFDNASGKPFDDAARTLAATTLARIAKAIKAVKL